MAIYDKLDWHFDGAISAGQPPENAFAHIGLYLAWLIRHDLHNPRFFPSDHVEAVKRGDMTGSDLADDIDAKLMPDVMARGGRAFSDARYDAYLTKYRELFQDSPEYGVVDNESNYRLAEDLLDRMFAEWVAEGRPKPSPPSRFEGSATAATSITVIAPPGFSREQMDEVLAPWTSEGVTVLPPPGEEQLPHVAPELEALIPRDLASPPMQIWSVRASQWGSSLLNRALKRLGTRPKDVVIATAIGGVGDGTLSVNIYRVPDVAEERLAAEFGAVFPPWPGATWQSREVAGRTVNWASGTGMTSAYWIREAMVVDVNGDAESIERAVGRLP